MVVQCKSPVKLDDKPLREETLESRQCCSWRGEEGGNTSGKERLPLAYRRQQLRWNRQHGTIISQVTRLVAEERDREVKLHLLLRGTNRRRRRRHQVVSHLPAKNQLALGFPLGSPLFSLRYICWALCWVIAFKFTDQYFLQPHDRPIKGRGRSDSDWLLQLEAYFFYTRSTTNIVVVVTLSVYLSIR